MPVSRAISLSGGGNYCQTEYRTRNESSPFLLMIKVTHCKPPHEIVRSHLKLTFASLNDLTTVLFKKCFKNNDLKLSSNYKSQLMHRQCISISFCTNFIPYIQVKPMDFYTNIYLKQLINIHIRNILYLYKFPHWRREGFRDLLAAF